MELTPRAIVAELDKYIVGQQDAKRAVAVALRNRDRRRALPPEKAHEILPKNILMIGPTGVGKTEIARRVAALVKAPLLKVEATQFTEVGYVGRDVDSILQELVEISVRQVHEEKLKEVEGQAEGMAKERLLDYLCQQVTSKGRASRARGRKAALKGGSAQTLEESITSREIIEPAEGVAASGRALPRSLVRERVAHLLENQQLEDQIIEIEVGAEAESYAPVLEFCPGMSPEEMGEAFEDFLDNYKGFRARRRRRRVPVREARHILARDEANKLVDFDQVIETALRRVEENGIIFIDELDKIIGPRIEVGRDVSGEGVQRDLLPILEGCGVMTRYGSVRTDHILFIAAGAFQRHRPSELIPEIQGRFPLRVELSPLGEEELRAILTQPENALTKQYQALLSTEGVELEFTEDGLAEIAHGAALMNQKMENIGARRLETILEKVLQETSFSAPEHRGERVRVDATFVALRLDDLLSDEDLSRYIL